MAFTIVRVASGGIPVVESDRGLPYYEADNGYGIPVTFGSTGIPLGSVGTPLARLVNTLKANGVWAKLNALYIFAQPTQVEAVKNLVTPGTFDLVATNSPTFTANQGFTGDGVSMHLLGPAFSSFTGYTLNNHSAGVFSLNTQQANLGIMATDAASQGFGVTSADTSREVVTRSGNTAIDALPDANSGICHIAYSRSSSASFSQFVDRMKTTTASATVAIPTTAKLTFLRAGTAYTQNKVGAGWIGNQALTDADYSTLDSALSSYLRQVGAYTATRGLEGAWTWFNDPRVISVSGVPVVGAITSNGSPVAMRENSSTGLTERAVFRNLLLTDDHCNPGIIQRATDSKIIAGYNKHNDNAFYTRISTSANDVTAFNAEIDIANQLGVGGGTNNFAYANFVELTGDSSTGASTNLTFWSNSITAASSHWTCQACSGVVGQTDPFGGTNASLVTADGTTAQHRAISTDSTAFTSGQPYAVSFYVKKGTGQYVQIVFGSAAFGASKYATFDLTNNVVVAGSTQGCTSTYMYPAPNGFYRIVAVATATAGASANSATLSFSDGSNTRSPSILSSDTMTVIQGQCENATAASPPIVTVGSTAARSATTDVLWLFFRGTTSSVWTLHYSTSIDGGDTTWTPATRMLWDGRPYWKSRANGTGRIDFVCNDQNPGDATYAYCNTYHFYYQGGSFFKSDGTSAGSLPLIQTGPTKVYDSQASGLDSWVWDLRIFSGNPVTCFAIVKPTTDHRYHQARWNGSAWVDNEICAAGGYIYAGQPQYSGGVAQDPTDINTVYCSRQVDGSGNAVSSGGTFQLFKYVTANGGTTWTGTQLTFGTTHCIRPYIADGIRYLYYVYGTYTSYSSYQTTIEKIAI